MRSMTSLYPFLYRNLRACRSAFHFMFIFVVVTVVVSVQLSRQVAGRFENPRNLWNDSAAFLEEDRGERNKPGQHLLELHHRADGQKPPPGSSSVLEWSDSETQPTFSPLMKNLTTPLLEATSKTRKQSEQEPRLHSSSKSPKQLNSSSVPKDPNTMEKNKTTPENDTPVVVVEDSLTPPSAPSPSSFSPTIVYSTARGDRAGAAVHDMLFAHAYAYSQNWTYGGACSGATARTPQMRYNATKRLLHALDMDTVLPQSCPPVGGIHNSSTGVVLNPREYRKDNRFFTNEWRAALLDRIHATKRTSDDDTYHVVAHIRRGDVNPCDYPSRYLPNQHYRTLIQRYTNETLANNFDVSIYSQSQSFEPFDEFRDLNYTLALDVSLIDTWKAMMTADVLIMSRSSFSYVPAILNPNVVVYTSFWHKPIDGWSSVDAVEESSSLLQESNASIQRMRQDQQCETTPPITKKNNNSVAV